MKININTLRIAVAILTLPLLWSCDKHELSDVGSDTTSTVPEGMVEIRPVLPGMYSPIPRRKSDGRSAASRTYPSNEETGNMLAKNTLTRLPIGSTIWLIAKSTDNTTNPPKETYVKKSYVVYNPVDDEQMSYLVPCSVDDDGNVIRDKETGNMLLDGAPLYLKEGKTYQFFAISPARKLDADMFAQGKMGFQVKHGEYFYAHDCRYRATQPGTIKVTANISEGVCVAELSPLMNQSAELKFQRRKGAGVHDLDIQPSGIQVSGLQNDSPTANEYGNENGLYWHMSESEDDEPMILQHGDKNDTYNDYDYTIDSYGLVNIEVPILPMRSLSKPVIVVFRLKINGVPTTYELMLNEKDFKAGYSYGYRGEVNIENGVDVISWQYVSWEYDVEFTPDKI